MRQPIIDLFASRFLNQTLDCFSWKLDPLSEGADAVQLDRSHQRNHILNAFHPFVVIPAVLTKVVQDKVQSLILINSPWHTQLWYPEILGLLTEKPLIIEKQAILLRNYEGKGHHLTANNSLTFVRQELFNLRISQTAASLITDAPRPNNNSNCKST